MRKRNGKTVVLVAEDEPVVRNLVQMALTLAGYHVLSAADGAEALQLSRTYEGPIDLLLSDVKMPKLTGPELAVALIRERPSIRVLLMTGKSSGTIPHPLRLTLLHKPFLPNKMVEQVRQVLAGATHN